jgi:hypothetical protein
MLHAAAVFSGSHLVLEPLSNQQLHLKLLQLMGKATVSGVVKTWLPGIKRESLHLPRWSDFGTSESMASARTSATADDGDHHILLDTVQRLQYLQITVLRSGSSNITSTGNSRLSLLPECHIFGASRVNSQGNLFPAPKKLLLKVAQIPCYNKSCRSQYMLEEKVKRAASHLNECRGSDQTRTRQRDSMILGILTSVDGLLGAIQPHKQSNKMTW